MFDFSEEAELFSGRGKKAGASRVGFRRFNHVSEAILFAVEELAPAILNAATLQVGERRYHGREIRALYGRDDFPLPRRSPSSARTGEVELP